MDKLQEQFESGDLDDQYAEFIMNNSKGERIICNGRTLVAAMEDGYLLEEFMKFMRNK